jgi:NAD-dependent SIR2 family protein deacetylase
MKTKVVYVLGAGFSIEAGAPSQERLVEKIFETYKRNPSILSKAKMNEFEAFLKHTLHIPESLRETIPLEDIFTPLDRCIADNIAFRNLSVGELKKKRQLIFELIGKTLQFILKSTDKDYINLFGKYLVQVAKQREKREYVKVADPISVITTNWDILLDNSIYNEIALRRYDAVVDYCCYISSYDKFDKTVKPGLEVLGRGGFNVKLLKLHGSLNWLNCPRCQRLYVKVNKKISLDPYNGITKRTCWHCNENFKNYPSHELVSNLIMPTFLKDLSNPQYKLIWQNAGIELSEARKIVFIGYSLPQADFEMRQLLSRMVDEKTEIEVVDFKNPKDKGAKFKALISSYEQFFGRDVKSYKHGASKYINSKIKPLLIS